MTRAPIQLTLGEKVVLPLVAEGLSNREIGVRLHIERQSVAFRLTGLFAKARVENRTELVAWAYKHGHLEVSPAPEPVQIWRRGYVMLDQHGNVRAFMLAA